MRPRVRRGTAANPKLGKPDDGPAAQDLTVAPKHCPTSLPHPQEARGSAADSLDHLIGAGEEHGWHLKPNSLCGLEVYGEVVPCWLLEGEIAGFRAFKDGVHQGSGAPEALAKVGRV